MPVTCSAAGQARATVAVWLAMSAVPDGEAVVRNVLERYPSNPTLVLQQGQIPGATVGRSDAKLALEMFTAQSIDVQSLLDRRLAEIRNPSATSEQLAQWLGISAPPRTDPGYFQTPCS